MLNSYHNSICARIAARGDAIVAAAKAGRGLSPAEAADIGALLRTQAQRADRLEAEIAGLRAAPAAKRARKPVSDAVRRKVLAALQAAGGRLPNASARSLAARLGGSKSTMAAVLKALEAEGIVRRHGGAITLARA